MTEGQKLGQKQRKRKSKQATSQLAQPTPRPSETVLSTLPAMEVIGLSAALAVLTGAVYAQVRNFGFVYLDDPVYVVENAWVLKGLSLAGVKWSLTTQAAGNWHPLTWVSHMIDVDLYGLKAGGHHVTSALIHVVNSILLFVALARMTGRLWASSVVAALFAVHPLHVESVAWVSERKDVLSALFWFLTIHAYISYVRRRKLARYLIVLILFALGLMSKPMTVTLPFTLLLLDFWPLRRVAPPSVTRVSAWLPLVKEKLPLLAVSIVSIVITVKAQGSYGAVVPLNQLPIGSRLGNAFVSYISYLRDLFWPVRLAAFYPYRDTSRWLIAVAGFSLAVITAVALKHGRRQPYILAGWAWYVGTLIPAIGIVQVGDQARADRYTYMPAIGLFVIVVWGTSEIMTGWRFAKPALQILAAIVIAACAAISLSQVSYWQNNVSLFTRAVNVSAENPRAEALLGVALSEQGRYADAIGHYNTSLKLRPGSAETHLNLGTALSDAGRIDEALREFTEAVRLNPNGAVYQYNLGVILSQKGRTGEAIEAIRKAVLLDPDNRQFNDALTQLQARQ